MWKDYQGPKKKRWQECSNNLEPACLSLKCEQRGCIYSASADPKKEVNGSWGISGQDGRGCGPLLHSSFLMIQIVMHLPAAGLFSWLVKGAPEKPCHCTLLLRIGKKWKASTMTCAVPNFVLLFFSRISELKISMGKHMRERQSSGFL